MMDYRYNGKIETDIDKNILTPVIVLCTRSGRKIGVINNIKNLKCNHPMGDAGEISFDIYKEVNGIKNIYWDFIKDFKLIFLPTVADRRFRWYEITVNIDESNDTIKHVTGIHANEAELGQLMLYDVEINTENDIARDDYEIITIDGKEYGTVFFNPEHPKASLLHRILSDKASHYSIVHVDDTLKNIQREFSFNGTSIVDALRQTIAQEVGCLFIFGEAPNNLDDNIFHRTLSAYDLMDYCEDCGERGNYTQGVCTNCGSKKIKYGYGKDTGIFVNSENLTESISFSSNTDQVKNFFKMGAGDEYMEAAIRNCNPNGSNYLSYFSDEMKEDMSDELVEKLNEYETLYDGYLKDYDIFLPANDVEEYNKLVNKYQDYIKEDIPVMDAIVKGYGELTNYDYNAVNFKDCLQTIMMPASGEVVETTAQEQIEKLTVESMSPIGTEDPSALSLTAANTAVQTYAKVYVDSSRYKIEINDSTYENNIWSGTITVTSLIDDEDTASTILSIEFNNDGAQFLKQKIQKMMEEHKVEDIGDVSFLQEDYTDEELETIFKPKLKKYSLDALSLLDDLCSATMDILADANQGTADSSYYEEFYHPYWKKRKLIMEEETVREEEIRIVEQVIEDIDTIREDIINTLDMRNYFGGELYSELMLYRRETEYSNTNFISDGLTDSEVIEKAQEYFKRAQKEIIKASNIQHSISCSLYNLFLIPEFRRILITDDTSQIQYIGEGLYVDSNGQVHNVGDEPSVISSTLKRFIDLFDSGNWLRIRVDDKVYKLRLINWEIDYENPEELDVEFSDVIYTGDTMSDIASLLSQARTMATSYNAVMRQAEKGNKANQTIQQTQKQGLILNQNKIINDVDTQNFVLNSQGALMRAKNDFDDEYSPEQIKLLNKGIYYTNDDWETVKAGLGHFMYYDPETKQTKEDYGIIASTIVGQLLLGENLKIYSQSGKFEMGDGGLKITAKDGEDNTDLFVVQKEKEDEQGRKYVEKYIYVDSDGDVKIAGNSVILGGKPLVEYIDEAIEDVSELSIYPKSNLPQSIIYSPDQNSFTPNWSESNLILSPSIWYGGEQLSTNNNNVTVTWSRREGIGAVTALTTGETVSDGTMVVSGETIPKGTLVVNQNKFTENSTMITYIVAVSYQEPTLSQALTAQDEITFTMTKQASTVKSATITGETIFKYNGDGTIKGTSTITLNGRVTGSGVNISAWQYQQSNGSWATYPNSTTSPTLTVRESDLVFTNDKCVIRLYTTDEDIYDYHTITKLRDGAAGTDTISAVLTNEDQMIPVSSSGTADYSDATSRIIIYESGEDVTSQWSIAVSYDSNNLTVTTSTTTAANDTVTITNMVGATGTISFTATKTGHDPILKQFSVIKIESGADGKSPTVYSLEPSTLVLNKTIGTTPTFTPSSVRFYAYQIKEQTKSIYKGRFKIYENVLAKDITSSTQAKYTSDSDENSGYHDYTPSASCTSIVCILYESGGTSTKLDTQTIAVTTDGQTGKQGDKGDDGTDALNIIVGNSYDGIPVDGDGKTTSAYTILIPFAGYQGTAKVATTVVNPPTLFGITPTTTNATTSADGSIQYIIPAGTSITNDNGVVTFTFKFTEANKTVTYDYSWGKARQGKDGGRWYSGTKITGTSTTATIFADSGITSAVIGDMYLNTSTYNTYRCTVGGNASAAKWIYVNNIKGTTGKGISSITNQYYLSTSDTTQSDGSWSDTPQTYIEGRYYWTRSHIVWDDGGSPTNTTPVLDNALTDANANAIDARKVATNYLSIDNTGIMVANMKDGEQKPSEATGRNVFIDNDSVDIRNGTLTLASFTGDNTKFYDPVYQKELATFGTSGAIIGANNEQRFVIEKDSVSAINENGAPVFSIVSTNKTFETEAQAAPAGEVSAFIYGSEVTLDAGDSVSENTFYIRNISAIIQIDHSSSILNNVKVNSVNVNATRIDYYDYDSYGYPYSKHSIVIPESPAFSCNYGVSKTTTYEITASFINDYNDSYNLTCSFTLTYDGQRKLTFSVFGGSCTRTSGNNKNQASFNLFGSKYTYSPVISSTAYTKAPAMTFGTRNGEDGMLSSVFGQGLYAEKDGEFVIGRFNEQELQTESKYAFVVGNGQTEGHRSNALTIDWSGNICFGVNVAGLDVDAELATAIINAGWDDDVYDD